MTSLAERALRGALVFCLAAAAPAPAARAAEPIVIGEINLLTGRLARHDQSVHQGIVLGVEEQNSNGGIAGRPAAVLSRDDEGRPGRAPAAAEELADRRQAAALIGSHVDSLVGPVAEVADRARVPCLATASLGPMERLEPRVALSTRPLLLLLDELPSGCRREAAGRCCASARGCATWGSPSSPSSTRPTRSRASPTGCACWTAA